ncbi:MAG: diguanylate cyclase [Rhodobacterales bacterium]|nr:MAG: diguanylate cyclase [Rhodobacterales bacterium]
MNDEIRHAFAHPVERAEATADAARPRDRISLRDYITEVEIGAFQLERGTTQRIRFNIVVEVTTSAEEAADDVDKILSYDRLTEAIAAELHDERLNLLETLADRVAERILQEPQALRVFVRIEKLDRGPGALGVEIVRARDGRSTAPDQGHVSVPHPRVVMLSNAAMDAPALPHWLDQLEADEAPAILCVGAPDQPGPQAGAPLPQRRIDLLALEQNAWVLAAKDRRCVVVGTRTELDWAMKHGHISVWAPPKMVLDAVDGPSANPRDAALLATWFATEMEAQELVFLGCAAPDGLDLRHRSLDLDAETLT